MKLHFFIVASVLLAPWVVPTREISFDKADAFPSSAYGLIATKRVIWFGEMHGTREAPQLFLGLVRLVSKHDKAPPIVALEIPTPEQAAIDRYLESGNESFLRSTRFFKSDLKDGRSSVAMVQLLTKLRVEKKATVVCFDSSQATSPQERDRAMAKNLFAAAKKYPNAKVVVLSGNVHASTTAGTSWDPIYRPAAFELKKEISSIVSFRLAFEAGTIYANTENGFGEHKVKGEPWNGTAPHYIKLYPLLQRGYHGAIFTRTLTGSPPW
jgi:erythromycin esterase-like protein